MNNQLSCSLDNPVTTPIKTAVFLPPSFIASIVKAMQEIPRGGKIYIEEPITINDEQDHIIITGKIANELTALHWLTWSNTMMGTLVFKTKSEKEIVFDQEDLTSLFFVIDKVIAGADPVSLEGMIEVCPGSSLKK